VLERPLLIKGEPGTGKTVLAEEVAKALGAPLLTWHIKSPPGTAGPLRNDAVSRLRDSQPATARVSDIPNYIKRGKADGKPSPMTAPGALDRRDDKGRYRISETISLLELDRMESSSTRPARIFKASLRPIVDDHVQQREGIAGRVPAPLLLPLTSSFRYRHMNRIVDVHFPGIKKRLVEEPCGSFSRCAKCLD